MADQMYECQQISLPLRRYESRFRAAVDYLSSQSLISHHDGKLQFFHQSFFDYVFARSFVDRGKSITLDLLSTGKHQGLFIRSQIRQVLAYLREADETNYEREIRTLLKDDGIRFHIRLLTIQHLASQANPVPVEYRLLKQFIQPEPLLWETFLEAINTPKWFQFLTQTLGAHFALGDASTYNRLYQLCRRIQLWCPDDLIQYLSQLPPSQERRQFIGSVLFILEDFSNPISLNLFEEAYATRYEDEMWFYHVMEHAVVSRPEWVGDQIQTRLVSEISALEASYDVKFPGDKYSHRLTKCLEKLHEKLPQKAFSVGLSIIESLLTKAKPFDIERDTANLISDSTFNHHTIEDADHGEQYVLLAKLELWLASLFETDSTKAVSLTEQLLQSNRMTIVALGLRGICSQPTALVDTFFDKLIKTRWLEEHDWVYHDYFEKAIKDALRVNFTHLTSAQQKTIVDKILAINPKHEYNHRQHKNCKLFTATGISQYEIMALLPQNFIDGYGPLKKRHQELKRKFPSHKVNSRSRGRIVTIGGRAMPSTAYERMTYKDWLNSFIRYNARSKPKWDGVDESTHAQRFEQEVKQQPDRFIELIKIIIERKDIPDLYLCHGLDGLAETDCESAVFKQLFMDSISRSENKEYVIRLLRLTDYWVKQKTFDEAIFGFLEHYALYGSEETHPYNEMDLLNRGVNTIRGAAIYRLYQWVHEEAYTERCFQIISQVAIDGSAATRAVALTEHAQFDHYDCKRNFELFLALCEGHEVALAKMAPRSLQYNIHVDFSTLIPYFELWVEVPETLHIMTQLVMIAYRNGYEGSDSLLERYLAEGPEAINGALDVALSALTEKNASRRERCTQIAFRFLDNDEDKVNEAYLSAFRKFETSDVGQLMPFLEAYAQSKAGKSRDHEFYEYLLKCVKEFPNECIRLASYFDKHLGPDIAHRYLRNEPIDVILQAYNRLEEFKHPTEEKECAMDVFDRILKNSEYRNLMNEITTKLN